MPRTRFSTLVLTAALIGAGFGASLSHAQSSTMATPAVADKPVRLRGTLVYVDATDLVMKERGGEVVTLKRAPDMRVAEVFPVKLADIKPGSYIGTAALPQAGGVQKALEVVVFPEAARGMAEGHFPWDLMPQSTMTNATVHGMSAAPARVHGGKMLVLQYKGGEQKVLVPANVPVVSFKPAKGIDANTLLVPGAQVLVTAQVKDNEPTALSVNAGRNGFKPPM
jgi:hypothetical protein